MWTQKIYHINVKKTKDHHQMKSLKIRCIGIFPILKKIQFNFFKLFWLSSFFFHFTLKFSSSHMNFLTNQILMDIYRVVYHYLCSKARHTYKIYSLIIIIITIFLIMVRYRVFRMSKVSTYPCFSYPMPRWCMHGFV
jgi:hypothetical protein